MERRLGRGVNARPAPRIAHRVSALVSRQRGPYELLQLAWRPRLRSDRRGDPVRRQHRPGDPPPPTHLSRNSNRPDQQGGHPPLLIMTDQEGGALKRLAGPPDLAPSAMTSTSTALAQGTATGRLLRAAGVNVDLAPVADFERVPGSFPGSRSFGSDPSVVANLACACAQGLQSEGVAYALKHFPGLGRATSSTDDGPVSVDATASEIRGDYLPYVPCAAGPLAIVMISNASYPNLTGPQPAVMAVLDIGESGARDEVCKASDLHNISRPVRARLGENTARRVRRGRRVQHQGPSEPAAVHDREREPRCLAGGRLSCRF